MMGKFPEDPSVQELRTLLGFRLAGIFVFSLVAAWNAWQGNTAGAVAIAVAIAVLCAVFVVPRLAQLRKKTAERRHEGEK